MPESVTTSRIVHVDPHQFGKIMGLLYCLLGVIIGLIAIADGGEALVGSTPL